MGSLNVASVAVSGAATSWIHERLALPPRTARVVHRGDDAVYVDDGGVCLGLLSRAAVGVPCGVRTILDSLPAGADEAVVGAGRFLLGDLEVSVTRLYDAVVPRVEEVPFVEAATDELPVAALDLLRDVDPGAVPMLLGRGSGLTPLGDDVLCGWLATRAALGRTVEPLAGEISRQAPARTTLLSATLLACAARGEVIPQFREVLSGRCSGDVLLAVGHTSGTGLALGMQLAR